MIPPASPEAEANLTSSAPDPGAERLTELSPVAPLPHAATGAFSSQMPTDMQEQVQVYVHERLRDLESQLLIDQQRQRDRVEEEVYQMRQQLGTTAQEQRQQHQTMSVTFREMLEDMRQEFSDVLQQFSRDVDHALRQSEAHNRQAIDKLRDEMLYMLSERVQDTAILQIPRELPGVQGEPSRPTAEDTGP